MVISIYTDLKSFYEEYAKESLLKPFLTYTHMEKFLSKPSH